MSLLQLSGVDALACNFATFTGYRLITAIDW